MCLTTGSAGLPASAATPPPNDNFSDRIELSGTQASFTANTIGATVEPGETVTGRQRFFGDTYPGLFGTVWWSWTAPDDGIVWVWCRSEDPALLLDFYSGDTLPALIPLSLDATALNRFNEPNTPILRAAVAKGGHYAIRAGGSLANSHRGIRGWLAFVPTTTRGTLQSPIALSGLPASETAQNPGTVASVTSYGPWAAQGEPAPESWFSWVAPTTGPVTVTLSLPPPEGPEYYLAGVFGSARPSSSTYPETATLGPLYTGFGLSVGIGSTETPLLEPPGGWVGSYRFDRVPFPYPYNQSDAFWLIPNSRLTLQAEAGTEYHFRVTGGGRPTTATRVTVRAGFPPVLDLLPPPRDGVVTRGDSVTLHAILRDVEPAAEPRTVEFLAVCLREEEPIRRKIASSPPYDVRWTDLPVGYHAIIAQVTDKFGPVTWSLPTMVTVLPDNTTPSKAAPLAGVPLDVSGWDLPFRICGSTPGGTDGLCGLWWKWIPAEDGTYSFTPEVVDSCLRGPADILNLEVFDASDPTAPSAATSLGKVAAGSKYDSSYRETALGVGNRSLVLQAHGGTPYLIRADHSGGFSSQGAIQSPFRFHVVKRVPPSVEIASPVDGSTHPLSSLPTLQVNLPGGGAGIREVQYYRAYIGPFSTYVLMANSFSFPFTAEIPPAFGYLFTDIGWSAPSQPTSYGPYTIVAKAIAEDGTIGVSQPVTFTVPVPAPLAPGVDDSLAAAAPLPPANDAFANRTAMGDSTAWFTGSGAGATTAPYEHFPAVWWSFTPSRSGRYTLVTHQASLVEISTGTPGVNAGGVITAITLPSPSLTGVTFLRQTTFDAVAGTEYAIALGDSSAYTGGSATMRLRVAPGSPPSLTLPLPSPFTTYPGQTVHLRPQVSDPDGSISNVVYFLDYVAFTNSKTPPFGVDYVVKKPLGSYDLQAMAYDSTGLLSPYVSFVAFIVQSPPQANDSFAARRLLTESPTALRTTGLSAGVEPGEPAFFSSSLWWSFTPTETATYAVLTTGADGIGVYTGAAVSQLNLVTNTTVHPPGQMLFEGQAGIAYNIGINATGQMTLQVVRDLAPSVALATPDPLRVIVGTTVPLSARASDSDDTVALVEYYVNGERVATGGGPEPFAAGFPSSYWPPRQYTLTAIAVDTRGVRSAPSSPVTLVIAPQPPPNDTFDSRTVLTGIRPSVQDSGYGATIDDGEPWPPLGDRDVWYTWTAPATGPCVVTLLPARGSDPSGLQVFKGASLATLQPIGEGRTPGFQGYSGPPLGVAFQAVAGEAYSIAVWTRDAFTLAIQPGAGPSVNLESFPDPSPDAVLSAARFRLTTDADPVSILGTMINSPATNSSVRFLPSTGTNAPFTSHLELLELRGLGSLPEQFPVYGLVLTAFQGTQVVWSSPATQVTRHFHPARVPNDDFAHRIRLTGATVSAPASSGLATVESGEPVPSGTTASSWWSWVAPASGMVVWDWTPLLPFQGDDLASLTRTPAYYPMFRVTGGQTYSFAKVSNDGWIDGGGVAFHLVQDEVVSPEMDSTGTLWFNVPSLPAGEVHVEASTNLVDWVRLGANSLSTTRYLPVDLHDPDSPALPHRFYRAVPGN